MKSLVDIDHILDLVQLGIIVVHYILFYCIFVSFTKFVLLNVQTNVRNVYAIIEDEDNEEKKILFLSIFRKKIECPYHRWRRY